MRLEWLELKVPPLALTAGAAAVTVLAARASADATVVESAIAFLVGGVTAVAGVGLALWGVLDFRCARTTVDPLHPERSARLVTRGVYRWTRNPMYVGFVLLLLGLAVALQSLAGLAVSAMVAAFLSRFQIAPEERMLMQRFGTEFEAYRRRTPRWL